MHVNTDQNRMLSKTQGQFHYSRGSFLVPQQFLCLQPLLRSTFLGPSIPKAFGLDLFHTQNTSPLNLSRLQLLVLRLPNLHYSIYSAPQSRLANRQPCTVARPRYVPLE